MRPTETGEHVVVEAKSGAVRGFWRTYSAAFLGIPFAEPPYGDLRFLAPVPVKSWSGVRDALRYGPTPQRKALAEVTTIPEPSISGNDILNLNVFAPRPRAANGPEELLPVRSRDPRLASRAGVGARQHRSVRWGSGARNERRPVCRRRCGDDAFEYTPSARTVHGRGVNLWSAH
jgi:Carboxylesterase family